MFGTRSRAPSEGALRVLRQLAYISSGTVCGAAALVAEERRRQIGLVSKIADNSRRLKQHPRYHHSLAIPRDLQDSSLQPPRSQNGTQNESQNESSDESSHQSDVFRSSNLPSEVDADYENVKEQEERNYRQLLAQHGPEKTMQRLEHNCLSYVSEGRYYLARRMFCNMVDHLGLVNQATNATWRLLQCFLRIGEDDAFMESMKPRTKRRMFRKAQHTLIVWMAANDMSLDLAVHRLASSCAAYPGNNNDRCLKTIFQVYGHRLSFSQPIYKALCAMLAETAKDMTALIFAKHIQPSERQSVIAACKPAWLAILNQLWWTTRNFDLIMATFDDMCRQAGPREPGIDLYNAMIAICIQAGRLGEAKNFLETIQESNYMEPDVHTFGHFVRNSAAAADWAATVKSLQGLSEKLPIEAPPENRAAIFASIFSEYAKDHNPDEIWTFAAQAIEKQGVPATDSIASIGVLAFARLRRLDYLSSWMRYMQKRGIATHISPYLAKGLIHQFYFEARPAHDVMVWLCRRLVRHVPEYTSVGLFRLLSEAAAYDIRGYNSRNKSRILQAEHMLNCLDDSLAREEESIPKPIAWWDWKREVSHKYNMSQAELNYMDVAADSTANSTRENSKEAKAAVSLDVESSMEEFHRTQPQDTNKLLTLHRRISNFSYGRNKQAETDLVVALSTGRFDEVLKIYKDSVAESGLPPSVFQLNVAIQAQQKQSAVNLADTYNDFAEPAATPVDLLESAQNAGFNAMAAISPALVERMRKADVSSSFHIDQIRNTVLKLYEHYIQNNMSVKHHVATATASVLIEKTRAEEAINLLSRIYHSPAGQTEPLDMVAMTVFLKAYLKTRHHKGIVWVLDKILKNNYRIERPLILVILRSRKELTNSIHMRSSRYRVRNTTRYDKLHRTLGRYLGLVMQRYHEQRRQSTRFGNKLIRWLITMAREPLISGADATIRSHDTHVPHGGRRKRVLRERKELRDRNYIRLR